MREVPAIGFDDPSGSASEVLAEPRHCQISARILNFPGGVPGDAGLFLR